MSKEVDNENLSSWSVQDIVDNLSRNDIILNLQRRNLSTSAEPGEAKYVRKNVLAARLAKYFEDMENATSSEEEPEVDVTVYHSASEGEGTETEKDDEETEEPTKKGGSGGNAYESLLKQQMQMQKQQNDMMMQFMKATLNSKGKDVSFSPESRKRSNTFNGSGSKKDDDNSSTLDERLEEALFKVGKGSERAAVRRHPYLNMLPGMGLEIPKNLGTLDDWQIVRAVLRWSSTLKRDVPHKNSLLYAFGKVPFIQNAPKNLKNSSEGSVLSQKCSILARLANAVDVYYEEADKPMTKLSIDQLMNEFQFQYAPSSGLGQYSFRASNGKVNNQSGNGGFTSQQPCFRWNEGRCNRGEDRCKFAHICTKCHKLGKRLSHPENECSSKGSNQ